MMLWIITPEAPVFLNKIKTLTTYAFITLTFIASSGEVLAGITVDKNVVDITTGKARRADILITNSGEETTRVSIVASRIDNAGLADERRWSPDNPRELGMIASPRELELQPGESRKVRLSFLTPAREVDQVYRLKVNPLMPDTTQIAGTGDTSKKIRLTISFDLLVILRPPEPELLYEAQRQGDALTLINKGNSNFLLFNGQQCEDAEREGSCQRIPAKRIYAGAQHTFQLPMADEPVSFLLNQSGNTQAVSF